MRALVLSGGGMFGAWQAGVWSALAGRFQPDLIVGCSVGALNGYVIAAGAPPERLLDLWRDPRRASFRNLERNLRELASYPLRRRFAITVTDLGRMQVRTYCDGDITWRHLAASCALPGLRLPVRLDGHWCADGGLLNALPLWVAADLGATGAIGLHVLPEFPSRLMQPAVNAFRAVFGCQPRLPDGFRVETLIPSERLGSLRDALVWKRANVDRWIALGTRDAQRLPECTFPI
jgi:predicted acylesterase/phospholipase RssA